MVPSLKQFEHLKIQLEAIKSATNNFTDENCIGRGGFGKVYKGEIDNTMVALKRLDREFGLGDPEFWKEIMMLSVYKHENIVSLLGYCDDSGEKILMYEYLPKKSLDLYLKSSELTWTYRDERPSITEIVRALEAALQCQVSGPSTSFPSPADSSSYSSIKRTQPCLQYKFHEIQLATNNFDETLIVGKGRSGKVYKGNVFNGSSLVVAAIKRMDSTYNQEADEFWSEVELLSTFRHCNIASLIGYCNQGEEMILVYEYIPNGSLYDHLHKLVTPLSWLRRLNICIDAGRGLHYLHTGVEVGVIHRDIKSANVLLDENWTAKIADLGLAKIVPRNQTYVETDIKGTFGYLDADYVYTNNLTRKSDVYAFGVVLCELLCRKRAVDTSLDKEQFSLAIWAIESIKKGKLMQILDSDIREQIAPQSLKEFLRTAEACLHGDPEQRPTMAEVLVSLESVLTLQEKFNNSLQPTSKPARRTIFDRIFGGKVKNLP